MTTAQRYLIRRPEMRPLVFEGDQLAWVSAGDPRAREERAYLFRTTAGTLVYHHEASTGNTRDGKLVFQTTHLTSFSDEAALVGWPLGKQLLRRIGRSDLAERHLTDVRMSASIPALKQVTMRDGEPDLLFCGELVHEDRLKSEPYGFRATHRRFYALDYDREGTILLVTATCEGDEPEVFDAWTLMATPAEVYAALEWNKPETWLYSRDEPEIDAFTEPSAQNVTAMEALLPHLPALGPWVRVPLGGPDLAHEEFTRRHARWYAEYQREEAQKETGHEIDPNARWSLDFLRERVREMAAESATPDAGDLALLALYLAAELRAEPR